MKMQKELTEYTLLNKAKEFTTSLLEYTLHGLSREEIYEAVQYSYNKRFKNADAKIDNNYKNKTIDMSLIDVVDYIVEQEPIITAFGVMFKKPSQERNPIDNLIQSFLKTRKVYKKEMFKYDKGTELFNKYNLLQLLSKLDANAMYGGMGAYSCLYYNINVCSTTTTQGKSAISAAATFFEGFLCNNVKFLSMNDMVNFIGNVLSEKKNRKYNDKEWLDKPVSISDCFYKIISTCGFGYRPSQTDLTLIWDIICNMDQEDINRLYYKNNLFAFMENNSMVRAIKYLLRTLKVPYLDPNKVPEEIDVELHELLSIFEEYIFYNHLWIDKIDRIDWMPRKTTLIIDVTTRCCMKSAA